MPAPVPRGVRGDNAELCSFLLQLCISVTRLIEVASYMPTEGVLCGFLLVRRGEALMRLVSPVRADSLSDWSESFPSSTEKSSRPLRCLAAQPTRAPRVAS